MGGFLLFLLWLAGIGAAVAAARLAKPILAGGLAFSSPEPMPMPGRHFGRRLRRWWRDVDLGRRPPVSRIAPTVAADQALHVAITPIVDVRHARLAGLELSAVPSEAEMDDAETDDAGPPSAAVTSSTERDRRLLERAVAYGRKLGWRHSSTTLVVPLDDPAALFVNGNGPSVRLLERYAGDPVSTVPPLLLVLTDPADLEQRVRDRLQASPGITFAWRAATMPEAVPAGIAKLFLPAAVLLAEPDRTRALVVGGGQIVATGVADTATLQRLARCGVVLAEGPLFGRPQPLEKTARPAPAGADGG